MITTCEPEGALFEFYGLGLLYGNGKWRQGPDGFRNELVLFWQ